MAHKTDSRKRELVETTLTEAIDYYLTTLALEGKSPETIVWYSCKTAGSQPGYPHSPSKRGEHL